MATPKTTIPVTEEQLAYCQRITGETFYKVDSESDPTTDYTVKALRKNGKTYLTCTCPAGSQGAPRCKPRT